MEIMLDLETMGTGPTAAIVAIGAVKFNQQGIHDRFYRSVTLVSSAEAGLTIDPDTVMWWLSKSEAARDRLLLDPICLRQALLAFSEWYGEPDLCPMWGNGAPADNVWLRSAYKAVFMAPPWSFWNDRCYRTIKNMPRNLSVEFVRVGTYHNAVDDAESQAVHLIKMGVL